MKKDGLKFQVHAVDLELEADGLTLDADSIDVAVFSPPYFTVGGYTVVLMENVGRVLGYAMKPGGRVFMNFGQVQEDMARPFKARAALLKGACKELVGWQTIIWVKSVAIDKIQKGHYQPINSGKLLNYGFEYIFQFVKGDPKTAPDLNRLSIGVPFTDKSNMTRGSRGQHGDLHCAGDCWFIPYETTGSSKKKNHRHGFPLELARRCIALAGVKPGGTVLDLFMGGGTTAEAARLCGLNAVGVDRDPLILDKAQSAWAAREGERWVLPGAR